MNILPDNLKRFMPLHQQKIVVSSDEFKEVIERLEEEIKHIPTHNEGKMIFAHFFYAGCDWYIQDWNRETDNLFGYAILNEDVQMSEYGYMSLIELTQDGRIELDFYWEKQPLDKVLYDKYPDYFPNPNKELTVFLYPLERFERNIPDETIISAYESPDEIYPEVEKLTPDEFAERINDDMFNDQEYYVRFIKY
ncbi:hypothetical protein [Bacteroides sp. 51]|uniref:hypothetical protein n=1 Tax=Bacteroides sp. 51 TaxID=2302938 RepID=UPI0013D515F2|nr:hypothetical protein [Bacteroides sp. 51]NDV80785.1 hypothetical protein [Bacteroides sp. 51]